MWKEIEIPLLEFRLACPGNKLSRTFESENKTSHMANVYSGLVVEILENMINECDDLYCSTDCNNVGLLVSNEKEPPTDLRVFSSKQDDERLPLSSTEVKTWSKCHKGMVVFQADEVEQLNKRLQILEEDTEVIKQAFFSSVEERKKLIKELHQLFQIIHHFFCLQSQGTGEKTHAAALIINPRKDGRMGTGLSQVLIQDSNPALVTRGLRANNVLAFQETAESEEAFIPR